METDDDAEELTLAHDDTAVLILKSCKNQTQKWKGLDKTLKNVRPYLTSDKPALESEMNKFKEHFKITDEALGRDAWAGLFAQSYGLRGRHTKVFK
jgi:hypothetical protein